MWRRFTASYPGRLHDGKAGVVPGEPKVGEDAVAAFNARELPQLARMLNRIDPFADHEGIFVRRLGSSANRRGIMLWSRALPVRSPGPTLR